MIQIPVCRTVLNHKITYRWRLCDIKKFIRCYSKRALFRAIEWL